MRVGSSGIQDINYNYILRHRLVAPVEGQRGEPKKPDSELTASGFHAIAGSQPLAV
jgi:hypothetical protein